MTLAGRTFALNQSLLSLGGEPWIEDEIGNRAFEVDGKAFRLRRTLDLRDTTGTTLYTINRSLAHVRRTFEVKRGEQVVAGDRGGSASSPGRPVRDSHGRRRRAGRRRRLDRS